MVVANDGSVIGNTQLRPFMTGELNDDLAESEFDENLKREKAVEGVVVALKSRREMRGDEKQRDRTGTDRPGTRQHTKHHGSVKLRPMQQPPQAHRAYLIS